MRFNPRARADQSQIDNREGLGGMSGGGSRLPIPLPGGTGGRITGGTVVVLVLYLILSTCMGGGPLDPTGTTGTNQTQQPTQHAQGQACTGKQAEQDQGCQIDLFTTSIQDYWKKEFPAQTGSSYETIQTVRFSGVTNSACGTAQSEMGPFYCPNDMRVYLDTTFFDQMLTGQLGAEGGPFSIGYVVAHEYGHHIENLLGVLGQIRTQQGPNSDGVRVELMADCLAGAWAANATDTLDAQGQPIITEITQDDVRRAIDAAQAVGDDRIQKRSSGRVNPEAWTHGSAEQRMRWFTKGMQKGSIKACNTFARGVDLSNP
ncbi:MAG TPA: neutral zinc metallopeptidase [Marmoricola sp.]|nr:neutral zinc metallopeptidase [Marmoricola sp.]